MLPVAAPSGSKVTLNEHWKQMSHLAGVSECQPRERSCIFGHYASPTLAKA